jgi:hypothetical protein
MTTDQQEITDMTDQPAVLGAVAAVMDSVRSIAKGDRGPREQGSYKYRSAEDVVNELGVAFREQALFLQSRVVSTEHTTHTTSGKEGRTTTWSRSMVTMEYTITSLVDGSTLVCQGAGSGLDQSDKDRNKAMTAAHKYALCQAFMIPTGDADPDSEAPSPVDTPAARAVAERRAAQQPPAAAPAVAEAVRDNVNAAIDPHTSGRVQAGVAPAEQQLTQQVQATERAATEAITEASKLWVQAEGRGELPTFTPEQQKRSVAALVAAHTAKDRHTINRIILAAKAEGILNSIPEANGQTLAGRLAAGRGLV